MAWVVPAGGGAGWCEALSQRPQFDQVVKAHQPTTRTFVVAALTLEIIETCGLQRRGHQGQEGRLNAHHLHPQVIGSKDLMLKPLLAQPAAHRTRRRGGDGNGNGVVGHGSVMGGWRGCERRRKTG